MKLNKIFSISIVLTMCLLCKQGNTQEIASCSGNSFTINNLDLSWTLGECAIQSNSSGNTQLMEGFHQVDLIIVAVENYDSQLQFQVFPNPTKYQLNIQSDDNLKRWLFKIYDAQGKIIIEEEVVETSKLTKVDVSGLSIGSYFLQIIQNNRIINNTKFIKTK